jgi:hypothetical protein
MMYGPDFPHARGPWTCATQYLRLTLGELNVPEPEARAIVGENLVRLYGLDIDKLTLIADHVGPTIDDILTSPASEAEEAVPGYLRTPLEQMRNRTPSYF